MAESNEELQKFVSGRQSQLRQVRGLYEPEWKEIGEYVVPMRSDILGQNTPGQRIGTKAYDGTAIGAALLFADGMHGYTVSPAMQWFNLTIADDKVNQLPDVVEWLQEVQSRLYMALNRSNFYSEAWNYLYDGGTNGTAAIYSEEDLKTGIIAFETVHPGEGFIAENKFGEVDVYHRERPFTARQAVQMFGEKNLPEQIRTAYKNQPFQEFKFLHAVFPREEYDDRKLDAKNKPFASIWLHGQDVCKVSGYDDFPYAVWRYMKTGKEPYGRSPGAMAMCDIKGLNLIGKTLLAASQLAVDPAYNVPSELRGKVQLRPRGLNFYDKEKRVISAINSGGNFPAGIDREERKQRLIEQHYHVDFFLMLARAEGQMTATEVMERQGEKAMVLGAVNGRLNSEGLDSIIDRVFNIEQRAGRLPSPPDSLINMGGANIDIVYMGPLAQVQRRLFKTQGIRQGLETIIPFIQIFPGAAAKINEIETADEILQAAGFPQKCIRTDEEVEAIQQKNVEAAQAQIQQEQMAGMMDAVAKGAKADKDTGGTMSKMLAGALPGAANAPA